MALVGATQPLLAAFSFGIVVNAASAALFLHVSGNGSAIFKDGLRLVLITFLLSAALWAQVAFIATVIDTTTNSMPCQVGVIFSTLFDQLGRFAVEQYLLWAMNTGGKMSIAELLPQLLVVARFVVGMVFVGFSRTQVEPVCVATSSVLPVAIVVIALDGVLIAIFAARAFMTGLVSDVQANNSSASRSKSVLLVMVGFAIWTGTSIAMLLGMPEVSFIVRTAVPAGGLSILILIVTGCADSLVTPRDKPSHGPEAPSPRRINISRDISSSESNDWPPTRYEDLKEHAIRSSTTFMQPREAPRIADDKNELPNITRPITGIAGIGGLPIQGALFPPARTETTITSSGNGVARKMDLGSFKKKRNLFDFGKGDADKAPAGKLVIGNPILQGDNAQNPLNKIATIDLQEAAKAEKERRAMALRRESELIARRPPPPPPSGTPDEGLRRAVSVKRKEVASISSQAALTASNVNQQSRWTATTTSAQLSPGVEEIRRRSPRQSPQLHPDHQESRPVTPATPELALEPMPKVKPAPVPEPVMELAAVPAPEPAPKPVRAEKKSPPVPMPQPSAVRPAIRPSRMRPPSPKEEPAPEPVTVLQRRPTNGLPGNPKARGLKLAQETGNQNQQTVMFVNNIVYDDPTGVQNIIEGATDKASRTQGKGAPTRSGSVVNRPRPIPRKLERESQDLSNHRRSRSGGSLVSRKSILMSNPGSPGQLPPLPPPPKSAGSGIPSRPHPNNTKSMTVDEKMTLFFPSPPSGSMKQKTLAPIVPPIPNSFLESNHSPTSTDDYNRRSNRTTRTSAKTDDILSVDEIPLKDPSSQSRRSPEVYQDIADEVRSSWMAENSNRQTQRTESSSGDGAGKRASSPLLPPIRSSAWTESTDTRTHDTMLNWDSVRSPEVAVGVQVSRSVAKATDISRSNSKGSSESQEVAFMLDASAHDDIGKRGTWFLDDDSLVDTGRSSPSQWHRRVGDECPTFSGRKEQVRSRKMPPPTPLRLRAGSSKNAVVIQAAEPSPIESPKQAIEQIQAQLKKLDHPNPNRDSTESQVRRLALLENLEMEMGMQEDRWHEMQHDIGRDSISSLKTTSPNRNSRRESLIGVNHVVPDASARNSIALERRQSRRARMRNSATISKPAEEAVANPDKARVSVWQQRLAEAQMEYNDNVADKNRRSVNFLAVSLANLGSPTPPDSDESDEDTRLDAVATRSTRGQKSLWKPEARSGPRSAGMLWTPNATPAKKSDTALPGPSFRAAPRKQIAPLSIHSTQLWTKPHNTKTRATGGLWRPAWVAAQPSAEPQRTSKSEPQTQSQKAPRPLTQRPPRRNKRVTLLPDIVENPEPLPDKRGTLGIFQFPWGERSDTASVQPTRSTMVMAMPGTMTSGGQSKIAQAHEHRARQLESAEYSSSFFDDYDDEDQDQDSDFEGDDSEDDFDETTLWEIANLLKSDSVPSKLSLLPPRHPNPVVDDYMNDIPSDDDSGSSSRQSIVIGLEEERAPSEKPRDSVLWNGPSSAQTADHGKGLPHPDDKTWEAYGGNVETARAKPRMAAEAASIESDSLWAPGSDKHEDASSSSAPMWAAKGTPAKESNKAQGQVAGNLWSAPATSEEPAESQGMFKLSPNRSEYRTTTKEPAAQNMTRTPRPSTTQPLDNLTSTAMWSKTSGHKARFQQLSHGLWDHPASPEHTETEGMFIVDRSRSAYRTTAKEPAAKDMQRKPRPTEQKPLDNLESTNLWAAETTTSAERNWITGKSASGRSIPVRHQYRRTVAYRVDWEAALLEAIQASFRRKTATEAEWAAALEEAIELGSFNAATRHPVFAASTMGSAPVQDSHPAATGYVATSTAAAAAATVAPAATFSDPESDMIRAQIEALEQERLFAQQAAQEVISRLSMYQPAPAKEPVKEEPPVPAPAPAPAATTTTLWSQPGSMFRKAAAAMWTAQPAAAPVVEAPAPEPDKLESVRRKEKRREEILARIAAIESPEEKQPAFAEQALWNGGEEKSEQKDWLDETKEKAVAKRTSGVVLRY